jgi:glucokinase
MKLLSGDIGGTKTRLALLERGARDWEISEEQTYPSGDYGTLTEIVREFLETLDNAPGAAGFGLAGPIHQRRCRITNLPWLIDADEMEKELGIPKVTLLNDLEAIAWGLSALRDEDMATLQPGGDQPRGNRSIIAPGTGLGEAGLYWDGARYQPFATEGGHCSFAPATPQQFEFLQYLRNTLCRRPAWEDVVSGPGLVSIYSFLLQRANASPPEWFTRAQREGDPAAAIARKADSGQDPIAVEGIEEFVRFLGAEAGNLALKHMATAGLYIGGGIAPKILPWLQRPMLLQNFSDKGKMQRLMETIPVRVILNDRVALYGPALFLEAHA